MPARCAIGSPSTRSTTCSSCRLPREGCSTSIPPTPRCPTPTSPSATSTRRPTMWPWPTPARWRSAASSARTPRLAPCSRSRSSPPTPRPARQTTSSLCSSSSTRPRSSSTSSPRATTRAGLHARGQRGTVSQPCSRATSSLSRRTPWISSRSATTRAACSRPASP